VSKIRRKIFIIFIILLIVLVVSSSSFVFFQKNKSKPINTNPSATITPPAITEITWQEAIDLIQECQIQTVFQKHNLTVTLTNKNNQIFETIEPNIDDIFDQTNHLRSDCNDIIQTITE